MAGSPHIYKQRASLNGRRQRRLRGRRMVAYTPVTLSRGAIRPMCIEKRLPSDSSLHAGQQAQRSCDAGSAGLITVVRRFSGGR